MLDTNMKAQLQSYLQNLKTAVELVVFLDDSDKSAEVASLANDIASLSDKVSVAKADNSNERKPSMLVRSAATGSEIPLCRPAHGP